MANSAVYLGTIPYITGRRWSAPEYLHMISVVYDTPNVDLDIYTPAKNKHCAVAGVELIFSAEASLMFKSGSNIIAMPIVGKAGGYSKAVDEAIQFPCLVGESLKFRSSLAVDSGTFYIVEF